MKELWEHTCTSSTHATLSQVNEYIEERTHS